MLSRSILTLMIPVPLILFGLGAAFFIEYQKHQDSAAVSGGKELSPVEYVQLRVESFRQKSQAEAVVAQIDIRDSLAPAAEGWTRVPYAIAHGEQITGVVYEPGLLVKDTEKSIQDDFRSVQNGQKNAVTASYVNGDQVVAIKIRVIPEFDIATLEGQLVERLAGAATDVSGSGEPAAIFTVAGDIEFKQLPQVSIEIASQEVTPVSYRRLHGRVGQKLSIFIFSNADDAAISQVIHGIDYAALKTFAKVSEVVAMGTTSALGGVDVTSEEMRVATAQVYREAMASIDSAIQSADDQGDAAELAASIVAQASAEIETELSEQAQKPSFRDRLRGLLSAATSREPSIEPPKKTVCTKDKGFKHCSFVED